MGAPAGVTRVTIEVRVALKPGVMDAEAENVEKSLALLGLRPSPTVRTARIFELTFDDVAVEVAEARAREAVERLLANPVVHQVALRRVPA